MVNNNILWEFGVDFIDGTVYNGFVCGASWHFAKI